ncbi:asparagine synthase (glutamine-hydrolyzing) [Candidatus Giovannonibacteria bacterium]|nr:asparagine synthase (glutamine-hydrolyzing) [Candidatus Giovannonibacteria bacterium]
MCGINGFNFSDGKLLEAMNGKISHRGPDDSGVFLGEGVSLGNRRLAILDTSSLGRQPMSTPDGRYTITYNGELYNFRELRDELEAKGYKFRSRSDTEVLLYLFAEEREGALKKLNGIFAFAVWDSARKELFLARDPIGIKPLYYHFDGKRFIFSSEAKSIFCHHLSRTLDLAALNIYFRFLYVPAPLTLWREIKKFPPGHWARLKGDGLELVPYWRIGRGELIESRETCRDLVREIFFRAVKRQLISDRPLGLFLSGGVDSTAILAAMSREASGPVKTFSVGFETPIQSARYNADFNLARASAKYFGAEHRELVMSGRELREIFNKMVYHLDEPVSNPIQGATYLLAAFAKKEVDVVFGGDGGDELFGGYDRYWYNFQIDRLRSLPKALWANPPLRLLGRVLGRKSLAEKVHASPGLGRFLSFMAQKEDVVGRYLRPETNRPEAAPSFYARYFDEIWENDFTSQMMATDLATWLPDESLLRTDKLTMAHGLEERVPILDRELVELSLRIPTKYKVGSRRQGKLIFREALASALPPFILKERKRGWFSPASKWLRGDLKDFAREVLSESYCSASANLFNFGEIQKMLDEHLESKSYRLNTLWSLMTFQVWARQFLT